MKDHHEVHATMNLRTVNDFFDFCCRERGEDYIGEEELFNRKTLPIESKAKEIVDAINSHQCTVISGSTGSGKTTKVPQYIFDVGKRKGSNVKIICSQPRRLAATSIASRVAYEMNSRVGDLVGYHIGHEKACMNKNTAILFCTAGVLLQRLSSMKEAFPFTHIIVDEIHERSTDIDLIAILLKYRISQGATFKVIVMSATLDSSRFQNYFSPPEISKLQLDAGAFRNSLRAPQDSLRREFENNAGQMTYSSQESSGYKKLGFESQNSQEDWDMGDKSQSQLKVNSVWDNSANSGDIHSGVVSSTLPKDNDPWGSNNDWDWGKSNDDKGFKHRHNTGGKNQSVVEVETALKREYNDFVSSCTFDELLFEEAQNGHQPQSASPKAHQAKNSCIAVEGKIFDVGVLYMEQILQIVLQHRNNDNQKLSSEDIQYGKYLLHNFTFKKPNIHEDTIWICAQLVEYVNSLCQRHNKTNYAILIFIPGLGEIELVKEQIIHTFNKKNPLEENAYEERLEIFVVHSNSENNETEKKIFHPASENRQKVILATNIAESSITIPDVGFVFDFCLGKSKEQDDTNIQRLALTYTSKASCEQRRGRAGRVRPGWCFRFIPYMYWFYMSSFTPPELLRVSLEYAVLMIKKSELEPSFILRNAFDAPPPQKVHAAIRNLIDQGGMLEWKSDGTTGDLTFLGNLFASFPISPRLTKLVILGQCFGFPHEAIIIAAILSCENKKLFNSNCRNYIKNRVKWSFNTHSDHLSYLFLYQAYLDTDQSNRYYFIKENSMNTKVLKDISSRVQDLNKVINQYYLGESLTENNGYFLSYRDFTDKSSSSFSVREKVFILKFVIAGALYPDYAIPKPDNTNYFYDHVSMNFYDNTLPWEKKLAPAQQPLLSQSSAASLSSKSASRNRNSINSESVRQWKDTPLSQVDSCVLITGVLLGDDYHLIQILNQLLQYARPEARIVSLKEKNGLVVEFSDKRDVVYIGMILKRQRFLLYPPNSRAMGDVGAHERKVKVVIICSSAFNIISNSDHVEVEFESCNTIPIANDYIQGPLSFETIHRDFYELKRDSNAEDSPSSPKSFSLDSTPHPSDILTSSYRIMAFNQQFQSEKTKLLVGDTTILPGIISMLDVLLLVFNNSSLLKYNNEGYVTEYQLNKEKEQFTRVKLYASHLRGVNLIRIILSFLLSNERSQVPSKVYASKLRDFLLAMKKDIPSDLLHPKQDIPFINRWTDTCNSLLIAQRLLTRLVLWVFKQKFVPISIYDREEAGRNIHTPARTCTSVYPPYDVAVIMEKQEAYILKKGLLLLTKCSSNELVEFLSSSKESSNISSFFYSFVFDEKSSGDPKTILIKNLHNLESYYGKIITRSTPSERKQWVSLILDYLSFVERREVSQLSGDTITKQLILSSRTPDDDLNANVRVRRENDFIRYVFSSYGDSPKLVCSVNSCNSIVNMMELETRYHSLVNPKRLEGEALLVYSQLCNKFPLLQEGVISFARFSNPSTAKTPPKGEENSSFCQEYNSTVEQSNGAAQWLLCGSGCHCVGLAFKIKRIPGIDTDFLAFLLPTSPLKVLMSPLEIWKTYTIESRTFLNDLTMPYKIRYDEAVHDWSNSTVRAELQCTVASKENENETNQVPAVCGMIHTLHSTFIKRAPEDFHCRLCDIHLSTDNKKDWRNPNKKKASLSSKISNHFCRDESHKRNEEYYLWSADRLFKKSQKSDNHY